MGLLLGGIDIKAITITVMIIIIIITMTVTLHLLVIPIFRIRLISGPPHLKMRWGRRKGGEGNQIAVSRKGAGMAKVFQPSWWLSVALIELGVSMMGKIRS